MQLRFDEESDKRKNTQFLKQWRKMTDRNNETKVYGEYDASVVSSKARAYTMTTTDDGGAYYEPPSYSDVSETTTTTDDSGEYPEPNPNPDIGGTTSTTDSSGEYPEVTPDIDIGTTTTTTIIPVTSIALDETEVVLALGEDKRPVVRIFPEYATEQTLVWSSNNSSVVAVSQSGVLTAATTGKTLVTVATSDGSCVATTDVKVMIDTVTIKRDGDYNKVVFEHSGKVWRCINQDMVFSDDYLYNKTLSERSNYNFFTYYCKGDEINIIE